MTSEEQAYEFLSATFEDVFGRKVAVHPDLGARDVPGWDSFAQISIIAATEEHYKFEFTSRELDGLRNVGDFVKVVLAKVN
ncbi:acyl carrier protein [Methylobacterium sp. J-001]|uniref:acyl carrier protein n=1 Tax=Methylobacterium sp. J-001 TaxID=2836609 RepID=UPI001FB98EC7|nr:acyl carrier protein [Methylobacterium sp. J-001]MCJ2120616.1 acyl carrier protein [Methylobacterium sp. J-001]